MGIDQDAVRAAAGRFFDAELCFAVEVEQPAVPGGSSERWEPRMLVLRSASIGEALEAVEETIDLAPDRRIRLAGYFPAQLTPAASPAPVVCSLSRNGDRSVAA